MITKTVCGHKVYYKPLTAKQGAAKRSFARKYMPALLSVQNKLIAAGGDESKVTFTKREQEAMSQADVAPDEIGEQNIKTICGKPWTEATDEVFLEVCNELFGGNG